MLQTTLVSISPLLLIAVASLTFAYLFIRLNRRSAVMRAGLTALAEEHAKTLGQLRHEMEDLTERVLRAEDRAGVLVAPKPPASGFNLNKRSQAIRMLRRGAAADTIATTLALPLPEIELLQRIQRLSAPNGGVTSENAR